jgi:hypothetical protein
MYQDAVRRLFQYFESSQMRNTASLLTKPLSCKTQVVATQGASTATKPSFVGQGRRISALSDLVAGCSAITPHRTLRSQLRERELGFSDATKLDLDYKDS